MKKRTKKISVKCDCCGKDSVCGAIHRYTNEATCDDCLKYAPSHFGFMSTQDLHQYIKRKKAKKWWEFWK